MNDYGLHVDIRIYSIFDIYNMIKLKKLDISPDYARKYRCSDEFKRQLIQSILTGIPISNIIVQEYRFGYYRIVDGAQRLNTIVDFLENKFPVSDENDNKIYHSEMSFITQRKIQDYQLPLYVIRGYDDSASKVFSAVNASTMSVLPQEKRNYKFQKQGIPYVRRLAEKRVFKELILGKDVSFNQMQDEELVLRYLSFYYKGFEKYNGKMMQFLDDTLENYDLYKSRETETEKIFLDTCETVFDVFEDDAFIVPNSQRRRVNTALFDIIMYSFSKINKNKIKNRKHHIRESLYKLLNNDKEFQRAVLGNANTSKENVNMRFEMWLLEMKRICN